MSITLLLKHYLNANIQLIQGPQGPQGDIGPEGPSGPQGEPGATVHFGASVVKPIEYGREVSYSETATTDGIVTCIADAIYPDFGNVRIMGSINGFGAADDFNSDGLASITMPVAKGELGQ